MPLALNTHQVKERGKAAFPDSPWGLAWVTSWTVRKKPAGTRKWRHCRGREGREGGGRRASREASGEAARLGK